MGTAPIIYQDRQGVWLDQPFGAGSILLGPFANEAGAEAARDELGELLPKSEPWQPPPP